MARGGLRGDGDWPLGGSHGRRKGGSATRPYRSFDHQRRIIDGSGNAWFYGDVAVRAGRLTSVGALKGAQATKTIDAAGGVVAPGFIDVHTHVDGDILRSPYAENFVRDG
jgi:N-acyl-D-amino-acid deacylase